MTFATPKHLILASLLPVVLAGCGGGGGSVSAIDEVIDDTADFRTSFIQADPTPIENMPRSGSASYSGVAAYAENDDIQFDDSGVTILNASIVSDVTLETNFGTGDVTGDFSNFKAADGRVINGSLPLDEGKITDNFLTADVDGTMRVDGDRNDIDARMAGVFLGERYNAITGAFVGEMTSRSTGEVTTLNGIIGTER